MPASSLSTLLGTSGSAQCLSSSGKTPVPCWLRLEPAGSAASSSGVQTRSRSRSRLVFPQSPVQAPPC